MRGLGGLVYKEPRQVRATEVVRSVAGAKIDKTAISELRGKGLLVERLDEFFPPVRLSHRLPEVKGKHRYDEVV